MQILVEALNRISFVERYKEISQRHNEPNYDLLQKRVDKKQILGIFSVLGYRFKYIPVERFFVLSETVEDFEFKIDIKITSGICTFYMGVVHKGEYINHQYTNLAFLYRYLINDMDAPTTAPKYKDHEEFKAIAVAWMGLFEDLKKEFLRFCEDVVK